MDAQNARAKAPPIVPEINSHSCRPFVIEDDPSDIDFLLLALQRCGVPSSNVQIARDGDEAVSRLAALVRARMVDPVTDLPSFILLDLRLRRRPGLGVLEWIRSVPLLSGVPVMILTASESLSDVARARELGADSFYAKTFFFSDLVETARTVLRRWRVLTESVGSRPSVAETRPSAEVQP